MGTEMTTALPELTFDCEGYPADSLLDGIANFPVENKAGCARLLEHLEPAVAPYGWFTKDGTRYEIATGGWSGVESIVGALESNFLFWALAWESTHRGGLYVFELGER